jgi:hypothetical protein
VNIFVVEKDPVEAARSLLDKHIVKMPLESAQLLSTNHRVLDGKESRTPKNRKTYVFDDEREQILYKATMMNHPCTVWSRKTLGNYNWLCIHGIELCEEYTRRYGREHACKKVIDWCFLNPPQNIPKNPRITPFAQAMPEKYKNEDAVLAYRNYYIYEKFSIAKWKNSKTPSWFFQKNSYNFSQTLINNP